MDRGEIEIEIEKGEPEGGLGPDLVLDHHQDLEQRVRIHYLVEMTEIVTLLGGRKDGQMMVGDVLEEMIGTERMTQRNRMKIQEKKKMTVQMLMIQILLTNIEMTAPVG